MEQFVHLSETQQGALHKLILSLGAENMASLASQSPDAITALLEAFMQYESALVEQIVASLRPKVLAAGIAAADDSFLIEQLIRGIRTFAGKDEDNLLFSIREVEMVMAAAFLYSEQQRVALAVSSLGGRARRWALTCGTSVCNAFPTWDVLKQQMLHIFALSSQAYLVRSRFLPTRKGKKKWTHAADKDFRRCYVCRSPRHLRPQCPLRRARPAVSSQSPASHHESGTAQFMSTRGGHFLADQ